MSKQATCAERVGPAWASEKETLEEIWKAYCGEPSEEYDEDSLYEYGLSFDYVPSGTFKDQDEPYFRYQLSWGGPSDEIRFYSGHHYQLYRAEYWFLDWFDGASIDVTHEEIVKTLWDWFEGIGLDHLVDEAEG